MHEGLGFGWWAWMLTCWLLVIKLFHNLALFFCLLVRRCLMFLHDINLIRLWIWDSLIFYWFNRTAFFHTFLLLLFYGDLSWLFNLYSFHHEIEFIMLTTFQAEINFPGCCRFCRLFSCIFAFGGVLLGFWNYEGFALLLELLLQI